MPTRSATTRRHLHPFAFDTFREEAQMIQFRLQFAETHERTTLLRSIRDADRHASRRARSIRRRLGESLVRLGERVTGDASAPAWQR